jgi:UDP-N-acetylmuramoyl-tripeptide--D-alanyl-D-alanine ligase
MKYIMRSWLKLMLKTLAIMTLKKYQPAVVGVTGSVGKTSTKDAIAIVLSANKFVRKTQDNFNNEFGLPLTILGNWDSTKGILFWPKAILFSCFQLLIRRSYPEVLVLEYAADKPNDIRYLTSIARPTISVVTAVGDVPVHIEFYSGLDAVAREKARLIECLPSNGFAILNADEERVFAMREKTRAHVISYGFHKYAEVRITNYEIRTEKKKPIGIGFKIEYGGSFIPVRMNGVFGKHVAYAAAAAAAVGVTYGIHLVRIAECLLYYEPPAHRMECILGIKNTYILDDTYNASPLSMEAAFETAKSLPAVRRVAVLGDMKEIGEYTREAHEALGRKAAKFFSCLITIGVNAKFIGTTARNAGLHPKNLHHFNSAHEAEVKIKEYIKTKDLVLIKGSRAMKLEQLVDALRG